MRKALDFLTQLAKNNNKPWFDEHKDDYKSAKATLDALALDFMHGVEEFDPRVSGLGIKDITYRIYRDTRFSKDKTPYKTHFGVFLAKGGKKSMHAGYYFHIGTGTADTYPHAHMLAAGNYCYDPRAVKILREDISDGWQEFSNDILAPIGHHFKADMDGALKRVPKDYPADAPYADWMRMKSYCMVTEVDDAFITQDHLAQRVADIMQPTKPFIDYINSAVDYVNEEMSQEY